MTGLLCVLSRKNFLFSNAEFREDFTKQVIGTEGACDRTQMQLGLPQIFSQQVERGNQRRKLVLRGKQLHLHLAQSTDMTFARHENPFRRRLPADQLEQLHAQGLKTRTGFGRNQNTVLGQICFLAPLRVKKERKSEAKNRVTRPICSCQL